MRQWRGEAPSHRHPIWLGTLIYSASIWRSLDIMISLQKTFWQYVSIVGGATKCIITYKSEGTHQTEQEDGSRLIFVVSLYMVVHNVKSDAIESLSSICSCMKWAMYGTLSHTCRNRKHPHSFASSLNACADVVWPPPLRDDCVLIQFDCCLYESWWW